jgi:hypothetical protein
MRARSKKKMTEAEYWNQYSVVCDDIRGAINIFYIYNEINAFGAEGDNYPPMQKHADFWMVQTYSLQETLFVVLGRIFDESSNSHSVRKLLAATVAHPEFFSRAAFSGRAAARMSTPVPDRVNAVKEPTAADLKRLEDALKPYVEKYDRVYKPIRNQVFAHRERMDGGRLAGLFAKTRVEEVGEIIRFLSDLKDVLYELFQYGHEPVFRDGKLQAPSSVYEQEAKEIKSSTRGVLTDLYGPRAGKNER